MNVNPLISLNDFSVRELPEGYFDLIPQAAVRYSRFPVQSRHNAIWDFGRGPAGNYFVSLCGELSNALSVQLYEYDPRTGALSFCFDAAGEFAVSEREIPPSKIHTSLAVTNDGKMVMSTHTTARSPLHPYWLFDSHYEHIHEGYPGSHILLYDPERRTVENLGIPVKRDSIYGGCYDPEYHAFWFTTFLKGHLFRFDLATKKLRDFGQVTEFGSYAICRDRLGNLYTSSRSGHLFCIDTATQTLTDLGQLSPEPEVDLPTWAMHRLLGHGVNGPDGRLWVTLHFSNDIYAIDPETKRWERYDLSPAEGWRQTLPQMHAGHGFDSRGVLWFCVTRSLTGRPGVMGHLFRQDILRGGAPEYQGMLGIPQRTLGGISELHIDEDDMLHIADTNHADDMPGILAIDLKKLEQECNAPRQRSRDAYSYVIFSDGATVYPDEDFAAAASPTIHFNDYCNESAAFISAQANTAVQAPCASVCRVWERLPYLGEQAVKALRFTDDSLVAWCGEAGQIRLRLRPADAAVLERLDDVDDCPEAPALGFTCQAERLPARQGRRFCNAVTASGRLADGRWFFGTADGMLGWYDPATDRVFSLGAMGAHGPVHAIAVSGDGKVAYGVSGDPADLGHVFRFDDADGLRELGRTFLMPEGETVASSSQPTTVACNHDGSVLAVGTADRMGCIYCYSFDEI